MKACFENLSFLKDEDEELVMEVKDSISELQSLNFCLVGHFLIDKRINFNAMKNKVASLWRLGKGMSIRELNVSKYLFHFFHQVDMNRVLDGAPWMFDNQLFLLHQLKEGEVLNQPSINNVEF